MRFTIDHYEPREARPDLEHKYENLMYSCNTCNVRKGDRCPPEEARNAGHRFFKSDEDLWNEHFAKDSLYIKSKSNVGAFTVEFLDLNRRGLIRLRDLRLRLTECEQYVVEGITALRRFPIDLLPVGIRVEARDKVQEAMLVAHEMQNDIDALLQEFARSPFADEDPEDADRAKTRATKLKELEALYPGRWRAPRKRAKRRK